MKKQNQKSRKRKAVNKGDTPPKENQALQIKAGASEKRLGKERTPRSATKRPPEKMKDKEGSLFKYIGKSAQFLRESRVELKKVKWPTRKELLASTAVVIFLVLVVSFFLGLIDFGLIKIIKNIVG